MTTFLAHFENGLLRPERPLDLMEGDTVELTISKPDAFQPALTIEEWNRRLCSAKSIQEWVLLANSCPDPGPDYDVVEKMNETRKLSGFRMPDPMTGTPT